MGYILVSTGKIKTDISIINEEKMAADNNLEENEKQVEWK